MSIVKQREGITRALYCLMETVAIAAIGDLSTVKVKLTKSKRLQRRDFQVTDDTRKDTGMELKHLYIFICPSYKPIRRSGCGLVVIANVPARRSCAHVGDVGLRP